MPHLPDDFDQLSSACGYLADAIKYLSLGDKETAMRSRQTAETMLLEICARRHPETESKSEQEQPMSDDEPYLRNVTFATEEDARRDWQSLPPQYRTKERLDARLALVRKQ